MKKQTYTSANTSINKDKLPAIYSSGAAAKIPEGSTVLDYGCGRYVDHLTAAAAVKGWAFNCYDPFNYTEGRAVVSDYVLNSNVLNVIAEDSIVAEVVRTCVNYARVAALFTIYEGDKSGVGRVTGSDQYQRNEKRAAYIDMIKRLGYNAKSAGGCIVVTK